MIKLLLWAIVGASVGIYLGYLTLQPPLMYERTPTYTHKQYCHIQGGVYTIEKLKEYQFTQVKELIDVKKPSCQIGETIYTGKTIFGIDEE